MKEMMGKEDCSTLILQLKIIMIIQKQLEDYRSLVWTKSKSTLPIIWMTTTERHGELGPNRKRKKNQKQ